MLQMQLVDPAHDRQVGITDRPRKVVHRPPADVEQFGLACYG
jgi:hypothetical protein